MASFFLSYSSKQYAQDASHLGIKHIDSFHKEVGINHSYGGALYLPGVIVERESVWSNTFKHII